MNESILIVEDNPLNLKLAKVALSVEGFDVATATSAKEALEVLETFQPQLILMDIQMPQMDGLQLTQILKADPRYKDIKIIAVTAFAMKGDREKTLAAGCDDYLSKPVDTSYIIEVIRSHLDDTVVKKQEIIEPEVES